MRPIHFVGHHAPFSGRVDQRDLVVGRLAKIDFIAHRYYQVMRLDTFGYDRLGSIRRQRNDPLAIVLAHVQPAIRSRGDAVSAAAVLVPQRDLAIGADLVDPVAARIGKKDIALPVYRWVGGELVAL